MAETDNNGLVDFKVYAGERFKKPGGLPYGDRGLAQLIKKYRLPIIRIGWCKLIDPAAGDDRLREYTLHQEQRGPRRGRPRT
jgi:hypothetical protein